jgi:autotransporter-associated beta strand protein
MRSARFEQRGKGALPNAQLINNDVDPYLTRKIEPVSDVVLFPQQIAEDLKARSAWINIGLLCSSCFFLLATAPAEGGSANWNLNPGSSDWATATNWTPATVPFGESDVATFGISNLTNVVCGDSPDGIYASTVVAEVIFTEGASPYTITMTPVYDVVYPSLIEFHGAGITNRSGVTRTFIAAHSGNAKASGRVYFLNSSSAGENTVIVNEGGAYNAPDGMYGGFTQFLNTTNAATTTFISNGGTVSGAQGGVTDLLDESNAESATFVSNAGEVAGSDAAYTLIQTVGNIGTSTFIANAANVTEAEGGWIEWDYGTSAGANFILNGGTVPNAQGGQVYVYGGNGYATFTGNGGEGNQGQGGLIDLFGLPNSNETVVIANGGTDGGAGATILLEQSVTVSQAQFHVFGNGVLDLQYARTNRSVGSLEGDGIVLLAANKLSIGGNNLSTTFSGIIQDSGSVAKVGTGTLTLSGSSIYTGGTTVTQGTLLVANETGSGTGTGAVSVTAGTLGGSGIIAASVTVGTRSGAGAFLAPAAGGKKQLTLTIQSALTFKLDATYTYTFKAKQNKARTDKVVANGVTINGATITLVGQTQGSLKQGLTLTLISNTSASPISGTFANLPDGGIVTVNGNNFQASYSGGDGNDLTLTVVP